MLTIEWIVTTKCNYKCSYCWINNENIIEHDVSLDMIHLVYEKLKDIKKKIRLIIQGGEPSLCDKLQYICEKFSTICTDIIVHTNGSNINKLLNLPKNIKIYITYHKLSEYNNFIEAIEKLKSKFQVKCFIILDESNKENCLAIYNYCILHNIPINPNPIIDIHKKTLIHYDRDFIEKFNGNIYYYNKDMPFFFDKELNSVEIYNKSIQQHYNIKNFFCTNVSLCINIEGVVHTTCVNGYKFFKKIIDKNPFFNIFSCSTLDCLNKRGAIDMSGWII